MNLQKWFKGKEMTIPSKELLGEVLGSGELVGLKSHKVISDYVLLQYEDFDDSISIYELAHKCKEWASKRKHALSSTYYPHNNCICDMDNVTRNSKRFEGDTEPEAIFLACEWIFKQNKMKYTLTGKQEKIDGELGVSR